MTYSDPDLVEVVYQKTIALRDGPPPDIDALTGRIATALLSRPRVVFDIGGACGASYFRLRPLISWPFEWHVVETPAMVERAADLADGRLAFHDDLPEGPPDLIVASGVLQFMPDPMAALRRWVETGAPTILISRTPLADRAVTVTQRSRLSDNGPGPLPAGLRDREVTYESTAAPRAEVEAILTSCYDLTPFDEQGSGIKAGWRQPTISTHGWLCRRR